MEQIHLVIFRLEQQTFAFSIESIQQIIDMVTILPLPKADPLIEGVINYHGKMVPIIDLRRLFTEQIISLFRLHTPILLVTIEKQTIGLVVDEVLDINGISADQIADVNDFLPTGVPSIPSLRGLVSVAGETVMLLDLNHVLDPDQGKALSQIAAAVQEWTANNAPETEHPEK